MIVIKLTLSLHTRFLSCKLNDNQNGPYTLIIQHIDVNLGNTPEPAFSNHTCLHFSLITVH